MNLRIPGPTPVPPEVLNAMARPMVDHRGPEFSALLPRVTERLQGLFETKNDVLTLTCSGTGGLEAAIVNTLSPGEPVLAVSIGSFGERFGKTAETYGADVRWLRLEWGQAATPESVAAALDASPAVTTVLVTHNETSTGVTNPLEGIARAVKERDKLLLVDAVSSLGSLPCRVDAWGLDVVVTASQKGWMVPPGLAMLSVSPRAWEATARARMPRAYFDLAAAKRFLQRGQTPWTPALSIVFALDVALEMLLQQGLPAIHARHARAGATVRRAVREMGLQLFPAEERYASNTVTAVRVPPTVEVRALRKLLREEYGVVIAGGQDKLAESIFRIGHLGHIPQADLTAALDALAKALPRVGFALPVPTHRDAGER